MPVQLRERKRVPPAAAPAPASAPPSKKRKNTPDTAKAAPVEEPIAAEEAEEIPASSGKKEAPSKTSQSLTVGEAISPDCLEGEVETNDGVKTTLAQLLAKSKSGVVLFTYPKALTPGCTTQACLFRDSYEELSKTGLSIYGLSTDSTKANTSFKEKHNLPFPLLCDPSAILISAIGFKKSPKGTVRGVCVIDKDGKVLAKEAGGPAATFGVVKNLIESKEEE